MKLVRKSLVLAALVCSFGLFGVGSMAMAQTTPTEDAIASATSATGLDPAAIVTAYLTSIGPVFLQMLAVAFVISTAWTVYKYYKRGVKAS